LERIEISPLSKISLQVLEKEIQTSNGVFNMLSVKQDEFPEILIDFNSGNAFFITRLKNQTSSGRKYKVLLSEKIRDFIEDDLTESIQAVSIYSKLIKKFKKELKKSGSLNGL
jgi:hypothetical protein